MLNGCHSNRDCGGLDFSINSAPKLPNSLNNVPKLTPRQINLVLMSWAVMGQWRPDLRDDLRDFTEKISPEKLWVTERCN